MPLCSVEPCGGPQRNDDAAPDPVVNCYGCNKMYHLLCLGLPTYPSTTTRAAEMWSNTVDKLLSLLVFICDDCKLKTSVDVVRGISCVIAKMNGMIERAEKRDRFVRDQVAGLTTSVDKAVELSNRSFNDTSFNAPYFNDSEKKIDRMTEALEKLSASYASIDTRLSSLETNSNLTESIVTEKKSQDIPPEPEDPVSLLKFDFEGNAWILEGYSSDAACTYDLEGQLWISQKVNKPKTKKKLKKRLKKKNCDNHLTVVNKEVDGSGNRGGDGLGSDTPAAPDAASEIEEERPAVPADEISDNGPFSTVHRRPRLSARQSESYAAVLSGSVQTRGHTDTRRSQDLNNDGVRNTARGHGGSFKSPSSHSAYKWIYVSNCDNQTTTDDILQYVKRMIRSEDILCHSLLRQGLDPRSQRRLSFKVRVEASQADHLLRRNFWPDQVMTRIFNDSSDFTEQRQGLTNRPVRFNPKTNSCTCHHR